MNRRSLLIEATNGLSGDMFVAAAAELAGCEAEVVAIPGKLGLKNVRCVFSDVIRSSLKCRKFDVLEGDRPAESRPHHHHHHDDQDHGHDHHHGDAHDHHEPGHHEHRSLASICELIESGGFDRGVTTRALRMFKLLGEVEAAAHGIPVEQVHFHEVGAIDSIIDIVAAAVCIERLQAPRAFATPVCVGSGSVKTAHGSLPVPAPATEKLLQGCPTLAGDLPGEWTTPTGALILRELAPSFQLPALTTVRSALGGGSKNPHARPNALRLRLVEEAATAPAGFERDELCAIFANIDDMSGELLGADLLDQFLRAGARDALIHPVVMKKGRPGHQLEVLVEPADAHRIAGLIMQVTTTIGVRMLPVQRLKLPRETVSVTTRYGIVAAKRVTLPGGATRVLPEFEACRMLSEQQGVPLADVYRAALQGDVR